jgi:hypothetical protein
MARRRISHVIVGIIIGGIIGSALSYLLSGIFPQGPVKNLFFSALKVGFKAVQINLGFFDFTFGIGINITLVTVIFVFLAIYLLHRV